MSNPLVSVIIPAYNAEEFIAEALDSVFTQIYRPVEVIVVDDGSTDNTAEIIKIYQGSKTSNTDETIGFIRTYETNENEIDLIYLYQQNDGPSKARNTGIKAAKGEYIVFLDADDLLMPTTIEKQMLYITSNKDIPMVFGDASGFDSERKIISSVFKKNGYPECDEKGKVSNAFEKLLESNFILTGTVLLKKECLEKRGYFDESRRYGEDYDLWLRISMLHGIGCIPEILMLRRFHSHNLSKEQENFYKSKISLLEEIKKKYSSIIRKKGTDIDHYILLSIKKLSYFYYFKKQYRSAFKTFAQYIFYLYKAKLLPESK